MEVPKVWIKVVPSGKIVIDDRTLQIDQIFTYVFIHKTIRMFPFAQGITINVSNSCIK